MRDNKAFKLSLSALTFAVTFSLAAVPSFAAAPEASLTVNDLSILENRFFSHPFLHDPIEKRLERLECLVFGGSKGGTPEERLHRLMKSVAARAATPVPQATAPAAKAPATGQAAPSTAPGDSSSQYPILNTIEWKALKKTYPTESLDQRLDRLESKLFGMPAQTMAYIDRVERIKRTLGIGVQTKLDNPIANSRGPLGPMPKARPRGSDLDGGMTTPFQSPMIQQFEIGQGDGGEESFGGSFSIPFNFGTMFGTAGLDRHMQQMMEQMNKQMSEAQRLGPGSWRLDQKTGKWVEMETGAEMPRSGMAPDMVPSNPKTTKPHGQVDIAPKFQRFEPRMMREIPPYADPNSI